MSGILSFLSDSVLLRIVQGAMLGGAGVLIFLVAWTTRDIMHRTNSILYQLASLVLVAALPVAGFLLYFLIRPGTTVAEREMQRNFKIVAEKLSSLDDSDLALMLSPSRPQQNSSSSTPQNDSKTSPKKELTKTAS